MGLLDDYISPDGYGPWGAFYPSPLQARNDPSAAVAPPAPRPQAAGQPAQAMNLQPDGYMSIGGYQMPQFDSAPQQMATPSGQGAPSLGPNDAPGFGDRLSASLASIAHSKGLIPSLVNGIQSFASGQRTDPDAAGDNLTIQALRARGVSATDAQAAVANPAMMRALIGQYYGPNTPRAAAPSASPAQSAADQPAPSSPFMTQPTEPNLALPARPRLRQPSFGGVTANGLKWSVQS
jgi:hypothetical protein